MVRRVIREPDAEQTDPGTPGIVEARMVR